MALGALLLVAVRRVLALQRRTADPVAPGRRATAVVVGATVTLQAIALALVVT